MLFNSGGKVVNIFSYLAANSTKLALTQHRNVTSILRCTRKIIKLILLTSRTTNIIP